MPRAALFDRVAAAQARSAELMERTQPASVPCGGCTLCCRSGELILVTAEDGDYPYDTREIVVGDRAFRALQVKTDGACVYVTKNGCAIHGHAPLTCQVFSCAGLYASTTRAQRRATIAAAGRSVEGRAYVEALYAKGRDMHTLISRQAARQE
jgi:Fe-S-cluster containining protein